MSHRTLAYRPPDAPVHGTLFTPVTAAPSLAALVIGGSGGSEPTYIAESLAKEGIAALSIAYFGRPGLPQALSRVPIEYFLSALDVLRAEVPPGAKIATIGTSRGSEAAMLAAIHSRHRVHAVVASVPTNVVAGSPDGGPAWLLDGEPLAWTERLGPAANDDAYIKVEEVQGPVLLVAAGKDAIWPSAAMARAISERLRIHGDLYGHVLLEYPEAAHSLGYLIPELPRDLLPPDLEDDPATREARADAWPRVVEFLRQLTDSADQSTDL
ncbi:MAG: acyl-CoA thioester hydrolase/BAAT C-terminal domain-containing protein [Acidimicrobiales bacterium]